LQIYDYIYNSFLVIITTCELLQCLVTLDKTHKIPLTKDNTWHQVIMVVHKDVIYMNFSSIQTSLCGIVILQLILWLKNVIALFIFI
jgi:hypothetical protein